MGRDSPPAFDGEAFERRRHQKNCVRPHGEGSDREIIDTARGLIVGYGCADSDSIGRLQISIADAAPEGVRSAG